MEFLKILVPVDFSPCSEEAYRAALTLARQFKAELLVLHVVDTRALGSLADDLSLKAGSLTRALQKKARLKFRSFLMDRPLGIKIRRVIIPGVPFHEIVKMARHERVDLIIIGRHGGTGELEEIFFGSTAEKVVRIAPCAVLSIPLVTPSTGRPSSNG